MAREKLADCNRKVDHDHRADSADQTDDEQDERKCTDGESQLISQIIGNHAVSCCYVVPCYKEQDAGGNNDKISCHQDVAGDDLCP